MNAHRERLDRQREQRREEARLKRVRCNAIRPLREMLADTHFCVRLPHVSTGTVLLELGYPGGWSRQIAWADCTDRALVARLQLELIEEADAWLDRVSGEVVS